MTGAATPAVTAAIPEPKRRGPRAMFEAVEDRFERAARRVGPARVAILRAIVDRLAGESRGGVDRRDDRPGLRVRPLVLVDQTGIDPPAPCSRCHRVASSSSCPSSLFASVGVTCPGSSALAGAACSGSAISKCNDPDGPSRSSRISVVGIERQKRSAPGRARIGVQRDDAVPPLHRRKLDRPPDQGAGHPAPARLAQGVDADDLRRPLRVVSAPPATAG